ncbi:MAG TPA: hypothetical protein VLJ17_24620 [Xanthobacteraceae bacterium]|nr:hypothetical protein [Xanthobacteraceae bacterium]
MTDLATLIAEIEKEFPNYWWLVRNDGPKRYFAHIHPEAEPNGGAYGPSPAHALRGARMLARAAKQETQEAPH